MEKLIPFTINDLAKVTNHRSGEIKFGEKMLTIPKGVDPISFIKSSDTKYARGKPKSLKSMKSVKSFTSRYWE